MHDKVGPYDDIAPAHCFPPLWYRYRPKKKGMTRADQDERTKAIVADLLTGEPPADIAARYRLTVTTIKCKLWWHSFSLAYDRAEAELGSHRHVSFSERRDKIQADLEAQVKAKQKAWKGAS